MSITWTGIEAELKNYGIKLVANGPDNAEKIVFLEGADIREYYGCNPASFLDQFGNDEKMLFEAFELVNGITITE